MSFIRVKFVDYEYAIDCLSSDFLMYLQKSYIFEYDSKTTVKDLLIFLYKQDAECDISDEMKYIDTERFCIKSQSERYALRMDGNLEILLSYLEIKDEIQMIYTIGIAGGGEVDHDETKRMGLKLCFNPDEKIHAGRPHVHVYDKQSGENASIDLYTFEPIIGSIVRKKEKELIEFLKENQAKYLNYWNQITNGIKVLDVDI